MSLIGDLMRHDQMSLGIHDALDIVALCCARVAMARALDICSSGASASVLSMASRRLISLRIR